MSATENPTQSGSSTGDKLNELLRSAGAQELDPSTAGSFETYLSLILRWNARTNLTAVRDEDGILSRHFVESIVCAQAVPARVATLLDLGSGAGFPGIPIALCRTEIAVTLAESQGKKAAFLREAIRTLERPIAVYAARAETLQETFDCVTLRAVDRMEQAVQTAADLVRPCGWLTIMTTEGEVGPMREAAGHGFTWSASVPLPGGEQRLILMGRKEAAPSV